jgi:hypothetical protein
MVAFFRYYLKLDGSLLHYYVEVTWLSFSVITPYNHISRYRTWKQNAALIFKARVKMEVECHSETLASAYKSTLLQPSSLQRKSHRHESPENVHCGMIHSPSIFDSFLENTKAMECE